MKKFIRNILLFAIVMVVIDIVFGFVMRYCGSHAKGGFTRKEYRCFHELDQEILLFGASRCLHDYNPKIICDSLGMSCYNTGIHALSIIYHYANLTAALHNHKPKIVVYDLTIGDIGIEANYDKEIAAFRPFYGLGATKEIADELAPLEKYKVISSLYRYNGKCVEMLVDNIHPLRIIYDNGLRPKFGAMTVFPKIEQDKPLEELDSVKVSYLRKMISLCQENDIKLIFVVSPVYKKTTSIAFDPIKRMCEEAHVPFLDYYTDKEISPYSDFFFDSVHMNIDGANKFTKKFAHDLKAMLQDL